MEKKTKRNLKTLIIFCLVFLLSFSMIYGSIHILYRQAYPKKYQSIVSQYSEEFGVDKPLIYSVIRSESRFNPDAVSSIGACGLMQITEETFDWAKSKMDEKDLSTYQDIFDPETNIKYGTFILSLLLNEFGNYKTAIAAYHAGWGNVKQWLNDPEHSQDGEMVSDIPFPDTKAYVSQVLSSEKIYKRLYTEFQ